MFLNRNVSSEHATMGWAWDEDELVQETAAAAAESSWSLAAFHAPQIWRYMSCMADLTRVIESCCWHRTTDGQHADDAALDYTCSTSVPQQPATVCTLLVFHASLLVRMQPLPFKNIFYVFLSERDYVKLGSLLSQFRLSSVVCL